jgi:hypothetical protein
MKRLILASSVCAVAVALAAAPAVAGAIGNPSLSHRLPVNVPSSARQVTFEDGGRVRVSTVSPTPSSATDDNGGQTHHAEPGDDRGGSSGSTATHTPTSSLTPTGTDGRRGQTGHLEPGDRGASPTGTASSSTATSSTARTAPNPWETPTDSGDDHGDGTEVEPGEDKGASTAASEPGDHSSGRGGPGR